MFLVYLVIGALQMFFWWWWWECVDKHDPVTMSENETTTR